jgi:hypothetical protein
VRLEILVHKDKQALQARQGTLEQQALQAQLGTLETQEHAEFSQLQKTRHRLEQYKVMFGLIQQVESCLCTTTTSGLRLQVALLQTQVTQEQLMLYRFQLTSTELTET